MAGNNLEDCLYYVLLPCYAFLISVNISLEMEVKQKNYLLQEVKKEKKRKQEDKKKKFETPPPGIELGVADFASDGLTPVLPRRPW